MNLKVRKMFLVTSKRRNKRKMLIWSRRNPCNWEQWIMWMRLCRLGTNARRLWRSRWTPSTTKSKSWKRSSRRPPWSWVRGSRSLRGMPRWKWKSNLSNTRTKLRRRIARNLKTKKSGIQRKKSRKWMKYYKKTCASNGRSQNCRRRWMGRNE